MVDSYFVFPHRVNYVEKKDSFQKLMLRCWTDHNIIIIVDILVTKIIL